MGKGENLLLQWIQIAGAGGVGGGAAGKAGWLCNWEKLGISVV